MATRGVAPIKAHLIERGITLTQAGTVIGVTMTAMSDYLNGRQPIRRSRAKALARLVGVPFEEAWLPEHVARPGPGRPRKSERSAAAQRRSSTASRDD